MKKLSFLFLLATLLLACSNDDNDYVEIETIIPDVIPEFRTNLSELNLFNGNIADLIPSSKTYEYDINSKLFTDYATKQRLIALPEGEQMTSNGDGLPLFPDNTVIAKTFYYNLDERDLSLGKQIIETRLLIKINGLWETGNYKWNQDQTDAVLDLNASPIPVSWIDINGQSNSINYKIPSDNQCFTCHRTNQEKRPIGIKLRSLNMTINGLNQLQDLKDKQLLVGLNNISDVSVLPNWNNSINYTLEERARAYIDINCAHCHTDGGYCQDQSILRLDYETSFAESNILTQKNSIITRVSSDFQPGLTMPWIGTSVLHEEGVELLLEYLNSLF